MDYNREGRHKVTAGARAGRRVPNPQSSYKAGVAESSSSASAMLERFTVLIPSGQQIDVVINAKNLLVTYRDLHPGMLTAQNRLDGSSNGCAEPRAAPSTGCAGHAGCVPTRLFSLCLSPSLWSPQPLFSLPA